MEFALSISHEDGLCWLAAFVPFHLAVEVWTSSGFHSQDLPFRPCLEYPIQGPSLSVMSSLPPLIFHFLGLMWSHHPSHILECRHALPNLVGNPRFLLSAAF